MASRPSSYSNNNGSSADMLTAVDVTEPKKHAEPRSSPSSTNDDGDGLVGSRRSLSSSYNSDLISRDRPAKAAAMAAIALGSLSKSTPRPSSSSILHKHRTPSSHGCNSEYDHTASETINADMSIRRHLAVPSSLTTDDDGTVKKKRHSQYLASIMERDENGRFIKKKKINYQNLSKSPTTTIVTSSPTSSPTPSRSPSSDVSLVTVMKPEGLSKTTRFSEEINTVIDNSRNDTFVASMATESPLVLCHFDLGSQKEKTMKKEKRFLKVVTFDYSEQALRNLFLLSPSRADSVGFGTRLWLITHDMDQAHPDLLRWGLDGGKSIVLCSDRIFDDGGHTRMAPYLIKYFHHNQLKSLRRQLYYYGFDRRSATNDASHSVYVNPRFKRSVDPTTLDENIRLVRKRSSREGSTGGHQIFQVPSSVDIARRSKTSRFQQSLPTNLMHKTIVLSPTIDLNSSQSHTLTTRCGILDDGDSISARLSYPDQKTEKSDGHDTENFSDRSKAAWYIDNELQPFGRKKKVGKTNCISPLPKSGWAFPKPRQTSTTKKLELARSPQPPVRTMTSTPAVPPSEGTIGFNDLYVAANHLKPLQQSVDSRFREKAKNASNKSRSSTERHETATVNRNEHDQTWHIEIMTVEDMSHNERTIGGFDFDMASPHLSSDLISSFLSSPCRQVPSSMPASDETDFDNSTASASFQSPTMAQMWLEPLQSNESLDAASGKFLVRGQWTNGTPLINDEKSQHKVADEGGVVATIYGQGSSRCLEFSPIDASKKSRNRTDQAPAAISTPCSKFAATYTTSYGGSPSNFVPKRYAATTNHDLSPSISKQLADWFSTGAGDDEGVESPLSEIYPHAAQ